MPEVNDDASILIATSWQALRRAHLSSGETRLCDCTVVILFAGFFLEASLTELIDRLGRTQEMEKFIGLPFPGLQDKLAWFYKEYVARKKASTRKDLYRNGIVKKIKRKFPGFGQLHQFRNDVAHGVINNNARSLEKTLRLRKKAKDIVDSIFEIASKRGHDILRDTTYWQAIASHAPNGLRTGNWQPDTLQRG